MDNKRLFLLDAYALIYRAYYALIRSPRITSKGMNTSAIFGFCNTLDEILRKEDPSHIAVCFDPSGKTFRHEEYPEYKAQREKQPEDISIAVPYIKRILEAYRIPVIERAGYEADDVIGTLSRKAENEGYTTYMMTPDKDYGQLVTDKVFMYRPSLKGEGFEIRGPQQVCDRYGISSPRQVIDLLALEGDASDNIPGCPGVGEKTAVKLIDQWGSVENLLDHTSELKGALKKKIEDNADQIRFSKRLVTIKTDVPLDDISIDSLKRKTENVDALAEIYKELEFRMFLQRLTGGTGNARQSQTVAKDSATEGNIGSLFDFQTGDDALAKDTSAISDVNHDYRVLETAEEIGEAVSKASTSGKFGLCIHAEGEDSMTARWSGIAISTSPHSAWYAAMPSHPDRRNEIKSILSPLFTAGNTMMVSHDVKRDYIILKNEGITIDIPYYDTSVAHYLLESEMKHTLANVSTRYLGYEPMELPSRKSMPNTDETALRVCEQADIVLQLHEILSTKIKDEGEESLLTDIELPLIPVLAEMEITGVRVDVNELAELSARYTERLNDLEQEAFKIAGGTFNPASPMQVGEILFERLKIDSGAKRTKKGGYSTTEEILMKYRADHKIVDLILRIRALRKLLATYINALPALINPKTGKIHTSYNQTVTATGRISSTNPNLQNIPIRSDDGREIRRAFVADPGDLFMSADYSQIELRLMAEMSGDKEMVGAFLSGADIHQSTAAKIYHEAIENVTESQRRKAKTANFGIIYGISAFGLSERLGIPRSESKQLIEGYFRTYPSVKDYMDRSIEKARKNGYVTTIMGRKRILPDIASRNSVVRGYAERNAINAPIQGTAADIIKIAMVSIHREIEQSNLQSRMIMQVHDELIFNIKPNELERMQELVIRNMRDAYKGRVPLEVSCGVAENWLEAH